MVVEIIVLAEKPGMYTGGQSIKELLTMREKKEDQIQAFFWTAHTLLHFSFMMME